MPRKITKLPAAFDAATTATRAATEAFAGLQITTSGWKRSSPAPLWMRQALRPVDRAKRRTQRRVVRADLRQALKGGR